jgi:hypothetical protein
MFSGLMSRWMIPGWAARASATPTLRISLREVVALAQDVAVFPSISRSLRGFLFCPPHRFVDRQNVWMIGAERLAS